MSGIPFDSLLIAISAIGRLDGHRHPEDSAAEGREASEVQSDLGPLTDANDGTGHVPRFRGGCESRDQRAD
jgi:hypothetical protein